MSEGVITAHEVPNEDDLPSYNNVSNNSDDLNTFFNKYSHLSNDLKLKLISLGVTLDKLLMMDNQQILLFSTIDKSMSADLILLIGAVTQYKQDSNNNNNNNLDNNGIPLGLQANPYKLNQAQSQPIPLSTDAGPAPIHTNANVAFKLARKTNTNNTRTAQLRISTNNNNNQDIIRDPSEYSLCNILYVIQRDENYGFILVWIIMFGITLFTLIYGGINLYEYKCDSTCDLTETDNRSSYLDCTCGEYDYSGDQCGYDENSDRVDCYLYYNTKWELSMIIIPIIDFLLIFFYFIFKFRINIFKSFLYAICFIPMSIIMFVFGFAFGVALFGVFSPILFYSQCSKNRVINKKLYSDPENNNTHIDVIGTIVHNKDYRFVGIWIFMLAYTITGIVYCGIQVDEFQCKNCVSYCYDYECDEEYDIGDSCGYDSNGDTVYCEQNNNNNKFIYQILIAVIIFLDYLIIIFGFNKVCKMPIFKSMVLGIPMCCMMFGFSIPFSILGGIFTAITMSVCY